MPAPGWKGKETMNFGTFFPIEFKPDIMGPPKEEQLWKMMSFYECTDEPKPNGIF